MVIVLDGPALGEYVGDTLPRTRAGKKIAAGSRAFVRESRVGVVIASVLGQPKAGGVILASSALMGTYGGYRVRMFGARLFGRDLPMALLESAMALTLCVLAVWRIHAEIMVYADRGVTLFLH